MGVSFYYIRHLTTGYEASFFIPQHFTAVTKVFLLAEVFTAAFDGDFSLRLWRLHGIILTT